MSAIIQVTKEWVAYKSWHAQMLEKWANAIEALQNKPWDKF